MLLAGEVRGVAGVEGARDLGDAGDRVARDGGVCGDEGAEGAVEVALVGVLCREGGERLRDLGEVGEAGEEGALFVLVVADDRAVEVGDGSANGGEGLGVVVIGLERGRGGGEGGELAAEPLVAVLEPGEDVGMGKLVVHGDRSGGGVGSASEYNDAGSRTTMNLARFLVHRGARSFARRTIFGLAIGGIALVGGEGAASAFCRSTTCTGDCPRDEDGCKTTGEALFWPSRCVGFSVQEDGTANLPMEEVRAVIEAGFLAWTDLPCEVGAATIAFSPQGEVACRKAEYDPDGPNANVVMFQDTKWDYAGVENNLAKTTVTYDTGTGEIFDADIELNFAFNELTVGDDAVVYDLGSLVTHEIGHFIGLDHTPDPLATMFAGYAEGETIQRTLEDDDIAGVCAIYPPGRDAACAPEPNNGRGDACGGGEEAE